MPDITPNTYDAVLYPGFALAQAHPDRLATLATLFGMKPADVAHCRVLELGCGDGTNLISVALGLSQAECVGIDLAAAGIRKGQAVVQELGLKNVTLRHMSILDVERDFGGFDFIVAHGIYSWVPPDVRDKILTICKENLAENGVAYVSYNTYPGGHLREMVREMMLFHVREFTEPKQRVEQARALIKFVTESSSTEPTVYQMILQKELERITEFRDSSLFHDDLGEYNNPIYFYRFVEHAARHGLKYLSEANIREMQTGVFPPEVVEVLNRISNDRIAKEQYLDFLQCRRFRQTLLCHEDRELDDESRPEKVTHLYIASPMQPESAHVDVRSHDALAFLGPKNSSIKTDNPLVKAAMVALGEAWPQALHFSNLLAMAREVSGRASAHEAGMNEDAQVLGDMLLRAYAGGIVEFHVHPPRLAPQPSERPAASPLARLQNREGNKVTTLRHHSIGVDDALGRQLLQLLDGSRDRAALLNDLFASVESGAIAVEKDGEPVKNLQEVRQVLATELERNLEKLARLALLIV
jgi:methyltransferase-like protein/2-polyprenyl-3-methyl-5-hydroxy-6-metoxy-1,4-benzoquinol methylase